MTRHPLKSLWLASLAFCAASVWAKQPNPDFDPHISGEAFTKLCQANLTFARNAFDALEKDTSPATVENVFGKFDDLLDGIKSTSHASYFKSVHPDPAVQEAATRCTEEFSDFFTGVGLSRAFYNRVKAIDTSKLGPVEKYMVEKSLLDFRLAGVDKDEATRQRIRALQKEIDETGNIFAKNIREDVRYVETTADALEGLPQDYLDAHQPDENGVIRISTNYPDYIPVMTYSKSDALRHKLRVAARSRGYPQNDAVLKKILIKRYELANLLGFPTWADYAMADNMAKSPKRVQAFLDEIGEALKAPVKQELAVRLKRLQQIQPDAKQVQVWQAGYLEELMKRERFDLDAREVREYFTYDKVRDGILNLAETLFGIDIRPWDVEVWAPDVEAYEIYENGKLIGRFYLDSHPREGKYKHAAHWTLRTGVAGRQIPVSALGQNMPKGLMEHSDVETFLHEFGHLLHNIFAGHQKWYAISGMSMEHDFVEAPSQMLEEWVWDYDTLKTFAVNAKGEVIPESLVGKMNQARDFGLATNTAVQIYYANLSLNFYNRDPKDLDLLALTKSLAEKYSPYPFVEGTAFYANFGHLDGYSSNYYTYQWSLAIATDLFAKFREKGLRNPEVARFYRDKVLSVGGSKPADVFLEEFLGRPFSTRPYIEKLKHITP